MSYKNSFFGLVNLLLFLACPVEAQQVFKKTFAWTYEQNAKKVIVSSDSNIVIVTATGANGGNLAIVSTIKINQKGDSIWFFDAYVNHDASVYTIKEFSNGDLLISGTVSSDSLQGNDIWLLKLSASGNPIWFNSIPSQSIIWDIDGMELAPNGNVHLCAHSSMTGEHIITTDSLGNLTKWITLNHNVYFERGSLIKQPGGKINFLGHKILTSFAYREIRLFDISLSGDTSNSKNLFTTDSLYGPGAPFFDANYHISFFGSVAPNYENCLVKYDTLGNQLLLKKFKGLDYFGPNYSIESLSACKDGEFLLAGSKIANPIYNNYNGYLFKFDANGDSVWLNRFYGGTTKTIFRDATETPDGGFIAVGYEEFPNFLIQAVAYKTDSLGQMTANSIENQGKAENYFQLFPNPTVNQVSIHFIGDKANSFQLYNLQGQLILDKSFETARELRFKLSLNQLPAGYYICQIKHGGLLLATKKLIVISE